MAEKADWRHFIMRSLRTPEVYPVLLVGGFGCVAGVFTMAHFLRSDSDVNVRRRDPREALPGGDSDREQDEHAGSMMRFRYNALRRSVEGAPTQVFSSLNQRLSGKQEDRIEHDKPRLLKEHEGKHLPK